MNGNSACLTNKLLLCLCDRKLSASEHAELVDHVDQCSRCQIAFERFSGNSWRAEASPALSFGSATTTVLLDKKVAVPKKVECPERHKPQPARKSRPRSRLLVFGLACVGIAVSLAAIAGGIVWWQCNHIAPEAVNEKPSGVEHTLPGAAAKDNETASKWGSVLDPDQDCVISVEKNSLAIKVPGTPHDLFQLRSSGTNYARFNAPRVTQPAKGSFQVQVRTKTFSPPLFEFTLHGRDPWVSAGLLIWDNQDNYFRLEAAANASTLLPGVHLQRIVRGVSMSHWERETEKDVWLKVERVGDQFAVSSRGGDGAWRPQQRFTQNMSERLNVGVFAINMSSPPLEATFYDFQLETRSELPIVPPEPPKGR
jgi:regulation of enolase protein 1 (concanavalin A-like superfamily)